jgi:hypothetical protein
LTATTYYAAQEAGTCQSATRVPVTVVLDQFSKPTAQPTQTLCNGATILADLKVTGSGTVWYDALTGGNKLPLTTTLVDNTTYYAAQSSGDCESERIPVTVTATCHTVYGTMFPFVHEGDPAFDNMFPVIVKLYNVPPADAFDPIMYLWEHEALYTTSAFYYDGSIYVAGTPKYPGKIGLTNNPGLPIDWTYIGKTQQGTVNNTSVIGTGDVPTAPVGVYKFTNVAPGDYILEIYRPGYLVRWGKITINSNNPLGHREILAGDVNDDTQMAVDDVSKLNGKAAGYGAPNYNPRYDLNGDGYVKQTDNAILLFNLNATIEIYNETMEWLYY